MHRTRVSLRVLGLKKSLMMPLIRMRPMSTIIDLRSDTVTRPCQRMREAMSSAPVGDDVMQDDPTVNKLERTAADLLGFPSALFVPSGTMGNLIALGCHSRRGEEIIVGQDAHIFVYEGAGASAYLGLSMHTIPNQRDGRLDLGDISQAIRLENVHFPRTSLVCLENTHNRMGGRVLPSTYLAQVSALCLARGLKLHVDGARLGNAAVALGTSVSGLLEGVDSVSMCLSKGLGAPVGSVLAGPSDFIHEARRMRKSLGGGMRQSGVLAAAGLVALDSIDRLVEDHELAQELAAGLGTIPGVIAPVLSEIETNLVYFGLEADHPQGKKTADFIEHLAQRGILMTGGYGRENKLRAVTHRDVSREGIRTTLDVIRAWM